MKIIWKSLLALLLISLAAKAEPTIPTSAFFEGLRMQSAALSPDGRYVSMIVRADGDYFVRVFDRKAASFKTVMSADLKKRIIPQWCGWANDTRLLCSYSGERGEDGYFFAITRLVAVNADGTALKELHQGKVVGDKNSYVVHMQFQDNIIDWHTDNPNEVLMGKAEDSDGYPAVIAMDVYTGKSRRVMTKHYPIRDFVSDGQGNVRLGVGFKDNTNDTNIYYFGRLIGDDKWQQLGKVQNFSNNNAYCQPAAVVPNSNIAYCTASSQGRNALWQMDLSDKTAPREVFAHPEVDVGNALFTVDKQLIGVTYETDRTRVYYTDPALKAIADSLDAALPGHINTIVGISRDRTVLLARTESDVDPPGFLLVSKSESGWALQLIGSSYPGLRGKALANMREIHYTANDGTVIPGYLTVPVGSNGLNLPLVVMPHGGPVARDSWGFNEWVQFLASRGYAVLQMNFRGSSGYGDEWYSSAHQDWGGVTYSDITAATRWAIKQGMADPKRICIVGASFGGYAALLGATRNSDLYRCSVSISGVSDLVEMLHDDENYQGAKLRRKQFSDSYAKLTEDSPRRHVQNVNIPLMLIHGTHDYTVSEQQTELMASALKSAGRKFEKVVIEDANHYFQFDSDELTFYNSLDKFLGANLSVQ